MFLVIDNVSCITCRKRVVSMCDPNRNLVVGVWYVLVMLGVGRVGCVSLWLRVSPCVFVYDWICVWECESLWVLRICTSALAFVPRLTTPPYQDITSVMTSMGGMLFCSGWAYSDSEHGSANVCLCSPLIFFQKKAGGEYLQICQPSRVDFFFEK